MSDERKQPGKLTVTDQTRKLSDIMLEMSELLFREPDKIHSSEAAHVALFFANVAWNETTGLDHAREGYRNVWETIEADKPDLWNEFKSHDIDGMIDGLVEYKRAHYADDKRRILTCGTVDGKIRVEWLRPAAPDAPDADVKLEMQLYGLVRTGDRRGAIRVLRESCRLSRREATNRVAAIAAELGLH